MNEWRRQGWGCREPALALLQAKQLSVVLKLDFHIDFVWRKCPVILKRKCENQALGRKWWEPELRQHAWEKREVKGSSGENSKGTERTTGCEYNFCLFVCLIYLMYLFLAALGLRCCVRAFSSCGERGLLFVAVHGLLVAVASLVAEHGL